MSDAQRAALFRQIGRSMNQRAPFFPLFQPAQAIVSSSNLTNAVLGVDLAARRAGGWHEVTQPGPEPGRPRSRVPWPFLRFLGRRLVALVVLALGITFVAFVLTQLVPGDPALSNARPGHVRRPEAVAAYHAHWGIDKPLPVQYLALPLEPPRTATSGTSQLTHQPGADTTCSTRSPRRCELAFLSIAFAIVVGVAARRARGGAAEPRDRPRAPRRLARGHLDADVLARAARALRLLLQARLVPGRRPPRPRDRPRRGQ